MANLSAGQLASLSADLQRKYSAVRTSVPLNKTQFLAGLTLVDEELEALEVALFTAAPQNIKDWMTSAPGAIRQMIVETAVARKEGL